MEEIIGRMTFPSMFNETLRKFGKCNAYALVGESPISYEAADKQIKSVMAFLEKNGIEPGDKVAILSSNMPNWGIAFFAITFMGAVAVPILPDFSNTEVNNVITHSGARVLFVSTSLLAKSQEIVSEDLFLRISIDDFSLISGDSALSPFIPGTVPVKKYDIGKQILCQLYLDYKNCFVTLYFY